MSSAMIRTTTAVTMLNAGVKENVVPQRAEARVNFRVLPDEENDHVVEAVRKLIDDPLVQITSKPWKSNPGVADIDGPGYQRIQDSLRAVMPHIVVIPGLMMATTDSRHYADLTPNVYRFHPMAVEGDLIKTVHGTNERIMINRIDRGPAIYREMIRRVSAE